MKISEAAGKEILLNSALCILHSALKFSPNKIQKKE